MKAFFFKSFARDLKKIREQKVLASIRQAIEAVEAATHVQELGDIKKLAGTVDSYRFRVGQYRIGIVIDKEGNVYFARCLARGDFYKYFPE